MREITILDGLEGDVPISNNDSVTENVICVY